MDESPDNLPSEKEKGEWAKALGMFWVVVTDFVALPLGLSIIGVYGMKKWDWPMIVPIVLGVLGLCGAVWKTIKSQKR